MLIEKIVGKINDIDVTDRTVEYVDIEWFEAFKKVHRKTTETGRDIGIRLDDTVFKTGLVTGDVLYMDDSIVVVVNTPPCESILVTVAADYLHQVAKVCYEIGNRHAPLFFGDEDNTFVTPYNEPMLHILGQLHGITAEKKLLKFNFNRMISATVSSHHH